MDGTLDEEDVWMIFDELEVQYSPLQVSFSWSRQTADDEFPTCVTWHGRLRIQTMAKQTNPHSSSFSFSDVKLSNIQPEGYRVFSFP